MAVGERIPTPGNLLPLRQCGSWYVLEIRGAQHVPGYHPEEIGKGMDAAMYATDILGDWMQTTGKRAYPEFTTEHISAEPLVFNPERPLLLGLDLPAGTGGTPAGVPAQLSQYGQLYVWEAINAPRKRAQGLYDFVNDNLAPALYRKFCEPHGRRIRGEPRLQVVPWGDPAGRQRPPRSLGARGAAVEMPSAFEILRDGIDSVIGEGEDGKPIIEHRPGWDWIIGPGEVSLRKRMEMVRDLLKRQASTGLVGLILDPEATYLAEAFLGGYGYKERTDGQYELDPEKNEYSHCMNALEYLCSRLPYMSEERPESARVRRNEPRRRGAGRRLRTYG